MHANAEQLERQLVTDNQPRSPAPARPGTTQLGSYLAFGEETPDRVQPERKPTSGYDIIPPK